jgi:hypothetical protein
MKQAKYFTKAPIESMDKKCAAEVHMWRAVIDQIIEDFLSESNEPDAVKNRGDAKVWLRGNSEDFVEVCNLARVDVMLARNIIYKIVGGRDALY